MKKHFAIFLLTVLTLGLCVPPVFAQISGSVRGVCKDVQGNPMVGAVVVWSNLDSGQKYTLKTDKKGEYFSLGLSPGKYNVTLYANADDLKAGKQTDLLKNFRVQLDENTLDFDEKREQEKHAKGEGLTPEEQKQLQEQQAKQQKEQTTVKMLQAKLDAATTAIQAQDYDTAIASLTEANQIDATRDVLWFKLGDAYRLSAAKQTDPAEKQKRIGSALESYQKAIQLKQDAIQSGKEKDVAKANQSLGAYYNNLAEAYAKANKVDDAVKTYAQAAQLDPSDAGQYYFNTGAVLTNAGRADEANAAFDKCIAVDPTRADAYYQKGLNLLGKATLQGDKTVPAPGTVEALQKYLELAPNGPNAQNAKDLLASLGTPVETSFGTKKKPTKK